MIIVKKITATEMSLLDLSSYAALTCYNPEIPEIGKRIHVKDRLFETGHHTTLQHNSYTFAIDGLAVADVTFGLHLAASFYNSDQRSGRFCIDMFKNPDYGQFESYIRTFWPDVSNTVVSEIIEYIQYGIGVFNCYQPTAVAIAKRLLQEERPHFPEKNLESTAEKIANEQLRNFISIIFPTGLIFTVNFSTLVAFWQSAWTPVMKHVMDKMVAIVVDGEPELKEFFREEDRIGKEWSVKIAMNEVYITAPRAFMPQVNVDFEKLFIPPKAWQHPVDKLHFRPECMDNSIQRITFTEYVSVATMGQDQRHRTIQRGIPEFTREFYLAPLLQKLQLTSAAEELMQRWIKIIDVCPSTLAMNLAPYGAEIRYKKSAEINALLHESSKRLCWCAQEEIYNLALDVRKGLVAKLGDDNKLVQMLNPPCFADGKCLEGLRYCGRDIKLREHPDNYFVPRQV